MRSKRGRPGCTSVSHSWLLADCSTTYNHTPAGSGKIRGWGDVAAHLVEPDVALLEQVRCTHATTSEFPAQTYQIQQFKWGESLSLSIVTANRAASEHVHAMASPDLPI